MVNLRPFLMGRPKFLPGVLNFMLPGLGYLFLNYWIFALLSFCLFLFFLLTPALRWGIFFLSLLTSFHIRRLSVECTKDRTTLATYSIVGTVCFLGWMSLLAPVFKPLRHQMGSNEKALLMKRWILNCREALNRRPESISECEALPAVGRAPTDPWGQGFRYEIQGRRFLLWSPGPDGEFGSHDDYRYTFQ